MTNFSVGSMSKKVYAFVQRASGVAQDYYPEQMGVSLIVNAPWSFTAVWSVVRGWLDEKTRAKIKIVGGKPIKELLNYIDEDNIPDFLGGTNTQPLEHDIGPWNDFEVVDGCKRGDVVGIRRKQGLNLASESAQIFTIHDLQALPNNLLRDPQNSVRAAQELSQKQCVLQGQGCESVQKLPPKKLILSSYSAGSGDEHLTDFSVGL